MFVKNMLSALNLSFISVGFLENKDISIEKHVFCVEGIIDFKFMDTLDQFPAFLWASNITFGEREVCPWLIIFYIFCYNDEYK